MDLRAKYERIVENERMIGFEMALRPDQFCDLFDRPCHYCGHNEVVEIHRLDSYVGYEPSNCVPICDKCNRIKIYYHKSYLIEKPARQGEWTIYRSKMRGPVIRVWNHLMVFT